MKSRIVNSFSAAVALQGAVSAVMRTETKNISFTTKEEARVVSLSDIARADDTLESALNVLLLDESRYFSVNIKSSEEWSKKLEKRLGELITMEALGEASGEDVSELDELQLAKLRCSGRIDPELLLAQYMRAKMDRELLNVLQKYVRIEEEMSDKEIS